QTGRGHARGGGNIRRRRNRQVVGQVLQLHAHRYRGRVVGPELGPPGQRGLLDRGRAPCGGRRIGGAVLQLERSQVGVLFLRLPAYLDEFTLALGGDDS